MIIDKEYPATHSMSTSRFGIDKDGKVALLEFEDNGPVPTQCPDTCAEEIAPNDFASYKDCIRNGVKAISLGGGEPFEHPEIFEIIEALYPYAYVTVTSNGLPLLNEELFSKLSAIKPDKIHLSLHNPSDLEELNRIVQQISELERIGIKPGVNLLVVKSQIDEARKTYRELRKHLSASQIILLPMRHGDTPSPEDMKDVADGANFQSAACLLDCKAPENFVSVTWDKRVDRCSFASGKTKLRSLNYDGLMRALNQTEFKTCLM